jgi:hypothetical protein
MRVPSVCPHCSSLLCTSKEATSLQVPHVRPQPPAPYLFLSIDSTWVEGKESMDVRSTVLEGPISQEVLGYIVNKKLLTFIRIFPR